MSGIFDLNNPVWKCINKMVDLVLLTVLWILTSIPIVTIGASTTAVYYTVLKMIENQEGYITTTYWKAFRENFKESTACFLLVAIAMIVIVSDLIFFNINRNPVFDVLFWCMLVILILFAMMLCYLPGILARVENPIRKQFMMAFVFMIRYISWSILMLVAAGCVLAVGLFLCWPLLFISVGGIAYIHCLILNQIFKRNHMEVEEQGCY